VFFFAEDSHPPEADGGVVPPSRQRIKHLLHRCFKITEKNWNKIYGWKRSAICIYSL